VLAFPGLRIIGRASVPYANISTEIKEFKAGLTGTLLRVHESKLFFQVRRHEGQSPTEVLSLGASDWVDLSSASVAGVLNRVRDSCSEPDLEQQARQCFKFALNTTALGASSRFCDGSLQSKVRACGNGARPPSICQR
jgi:hypothetical protein